MEETGEIVVDVEEADKGGFLEYRVVLLDRFLVALPPADEVGVVASARVLWHRACRPGMIEVGLRRGEMEGDVKREVDDGMKRRG